jgi:hypothetical protein
MEKFESVRKIRNEVMHFDPDGIPEKDLMTLREFSRFLQRLQIIDELGVESAPSKMKQEKSFRKTPEAGGLREKDQL